MGRPSANDLRCRILQAYEQGEGSQPQLAQRFRVSVSYIEKIHCQWRRTGKMERIPHRPGRKPKFTEAIRERLRGWLQQRPDLTLAELQEKLLHEVFSRAVAGSRKDQTERTGLSNGLPIPLIIDD